MFPLIKDDAQFLLSIRGVCLHFFVDFSHGNKTVLVFFSLTLVDLDGFPCMGTVHKYTNLFVFLYCLRSTQRLLNQWFL